MIAIDTNVVVRLLVDDDPLQARRARALFESEPIMILTTVLLETEWVLRAAYGLQPSEIRTLFGLLLGLPGVTTDDPNRVGRALEGYGSGLDFADALHVAADAGARAFVTFDRALVRRAGAGAGMPAVHA